MIIELFGLPASGKTTLAQAWQEHGWKRVRITSKFELFSYSALFALLHPVRFVKLGFFTIRFSASPALLHLKLMNLLFYNLALWQKAQRVPRAILDQGPSQFLLSLFETRQDVHILKQLLNTLPKSDLVLVLDVPFEVRRERLEARGKIPREEFGVAVAERLARTAEIHFPEILTLYRIHGIPHQISNGENLKPERFFTQLSYVTFARMPTDKAHGISIAHMCASFVRQGFSVTLMTPRRKNVIRESVFDFYGISNSFEHQEIPVFDFLARGLTLPPFFFLQRLLFMRAVSKQRIRPGFIYTRDPEIAFIFRKTHLVIYEAHRMPRGFFGTLTARLVKEATLVVCNSKGTETAFRAHSVRNTVVAPNGFAPHLFTGPAKSRQELGLPEGFLALFVGSDQPWKGIDVVRQAAEDAAEGITFVIVGGGRTKKSAQCIEVGKVPSRNVPAYLQVADVLLLPNTTVSEESIVYTSPIKLFEYLAAAKPIIASDLPSIREILSDANAYFVEPGNPHALLDAIKVLKNDQLLRERLSNVAANLGRNYTWDARAQHVSATMKERV